MNNPGAEASGLFCFGILSGFIPSGSQSLLEPVNGESWLRHGRQSRFDLRAAQRLEQLRPGDAADLWPPLPAVHKDLLEPGLVVIPPQVRVTAPVGLATVGQQGRGIVDHDLMFGAGCRQAGALAVETGELLGQLSLFLLGDISWHAAIKGLLNPLSAIAFDNGEPAHAVLLSVAICCVGVSALITLRVLAPRLRTGEARSLLYFDHVARRYGGDREAFVARYLHLGQDEDALCVQVIEQMWANSVVARRKFRRVAVAIYLLGVAMFAAGVAVVLGRL